MQRLTLIKEKKKRNKIRFRIAQEIDCHVYQIIYHCESLYCIPYSSYPSKCSTQIYRAQYENAIFVSPGGDKYGGRKLKKNIWNLLLQLKPLVQHHEKENIHINTFHNKFTVQTAKITAWVIFFYQTWKPSFGHLNVVCCLPLLKSQNTNDAIELKDMEHFHGDQISVP